METSIKAFFGRNIGTKETVSKEQVKTFIAHNVDTVLECYTISKVTGVWRAQKEKTFVIEVITSNKEFAVTLAKVKGIAKEYAKQFRQDAVLVTTSQVYAHLVEQDEEIEEYLT